MAITTIKIGDRNITVDTSIADRLLSANRAKLKATGTPMQINQSFRTTEQQAELFRRSQAGEIGRAAPPGQSFHETGKAIDVTDFEESQAFLNRVGLRNDLEGDKGHFSLGETRAERHTGFAESVEKGRQRGFTDTELLNLFIQKQPSQKKAIETSRQRYEIDENIKNDRDLVNFMALRFSGIARLKTPSVAKKVEVEKPRFVERVKERIGERVETIEEKADLAAEGKISLFSQVVNFASQAIGALGDIAFEAVVSATPERLKDKIKDLASKAIKTDIGQAGLKAAQKGIEAFEKFRETNPEAATNIESIANFAEVIPVERAAVVGVKAVKTGVILTKEAAEGVGKFGAKAAKQATQKGKVVTDFGISQATGLNRETIDLIVKNPEKFTNDVLKTVDRESVAKDVISRIDERLDALKDTGKGYQTIRNSTDRTIIPERGLLDILNKKNIDLDEAGKIVTSPESIPLTPTDKKALQEFIDVFGKEKELSANAFLNARQSLSNLAKFEIGKSTAATTMAKDLRRFYDDLGKEQIKGLKQLDATYSSEISALKEVKKDFFKKTGEPKDNFVSIVATLTGKGKEVKLKRLKEIIPDIEDRIKILRAVEDVQGAGNLKVGTYARSLFGVSGILTGNPLLLLSSVLAVPEIAVKLLRSYGKFKKIASEVIEKIIDKFKKGVKLDKQEAKIFNDMINENEKTIKKLLK